VPTSLQSLVAEKYPVIAKDLLGPLLDLMTLSRGYCDGDIDKFLILLVIAVRTVEHREFAAYSQAQLLSGEVPVFPTLGTNARSIAASIGIPNETVRRKVTELIDKGWVVRRGHQLYFTAEAYRQLVPVREQLEALAIRYHQLISGLLAQCESAVRAAS
jgi:hypothetical protein